MIHRFAIRLGTIPCVLAAAWAAGGCSIAPPQTRRTPRYVSQQTAAVAPATAATTLDPAQPSGSDNPAWKQIAATLGKSGQFKDGVYTVVIPRDDLLVRIEGMDVPTSAGIASTFQFYQCSCGKTVVLGQFVLPDYEANDVVYALQKDDMTVSSIGPYVLYEKPRLLCVRFQAEGQPQALATTLRAALDWTGQNRMPPPHKLAQ